MSLLGASLSKGGSLLRVRSHLVMTEAKAYLLPPANELNALDPTSLHSPLTSSPLPNKGMRPPLSTPWLVTSGLIQTCSFEDTPPRHLVTTEARTVGKRAVCILLECFLFKFLFLARLFWGNHTIPRFSVRFLRGLRLLL